MVENTYINSPSYIPDGDVEGYFEDSSVEPDTISLIKKLVYTRGSYQYFSDVELVMCRIRSSEKRIAFFKALSRQSAVMARLKVRPDSDIDKVVTYWGSVPGVRIKDLRPLLESQRRLPEGGTISMLYLLPPFARERLYTSPLPSKSGDPSMDCHWTTLNFFREVPDDRFGDDVYTSAYIQANYYRIAKPGLYGDLVLVMNQAGQAIHSAVYLADDIVFTKNGSNYAQPWVLMRMKNLIGMYYAHVNSDAPRIAIYRANTQ